MTAMLSAILWAVAIALVVVGIAGTVLPALPGPILVLAGLVVGAWADGFTRVGWLTLGLLAVLAGISYLADLAAAALGVRRFGASKRAAVGAALGTLAGVFLGLPGLLLGPFAGAVLGEVWARGGLEGAGRAGAGAWVGFLLGALTKLAIVFTMVGLFALALFY